MSNTLYNCIPRPDWRGERESGNITLLCGVMLWLVLSKSTNIVIHSHFDPRYRVARSTTDNWEDEGRIV